MTPPSADDRYVVPRGRRDGRSKAGCNSIPLFSCPYLPRSRNHTRTCGKRHHPSHFCFLHQFPHPLSLPHTFPVHAVTSHATDSLPDSPDSCPLLFSSTLIFDAHSQHSSPTHILNTHLRHVILTYLQSTSQARIFRPHFEPARYALRTTYRHIHKVISVIRPSRKLMGIHTYHTLLTLGADITKKGGEFSFASPIVLPQRYSLYVNVQKLMLYAALLM